MEYASVYITCTSETEAKKIAQILVWERLAACVSFFPVDSVFWWKDNVEETKEIALIVKTRSELVDSIIDRVKQLHTDEIPCIYSNPIDKGNPDFLNWIKESTE